MLLFAIVPLALGESDAALGALADSLAVLGARRVTLIHIAAGIARSSTHVRLERCQRTFQQAGLQVETLVRSGSPAFEIVSAARELDADFIAFYWKGKSWLQRTLVGSTTGDTVRLSELPLFVCKNRRPAAGDPLTVVYATDFGATDATVMPYLKRSSLPIEQLILLNVGPRAPDPVAENHRLDSVVSSLQRLATEADAATLTTRAVTGTPRRQLVRQAKQLGAQLLVLGKNDERPSLRTMLGSTSEAVVFQSSCSLLIIPPQPLAGTARTRRRYEKD